MKQIQRVLYNTDEGDRDCRMLPVGYLCYYALRNVLEGPCTSKPPDTAKPLSPSSPSASNL